MFRFLAPRPYRLSLVQFGVSGAAAIACYLTIGQIVDGPSWSVIFHHAFVGVVLDRPGKRTDVDALRRYVHESRNRSDIERQENKEKTGVFTGAFATNPATGATIPRPRRVIATARAVATPSSTVRRARATPSSGRRCSRRRPASMRRAV